MAGESSLCDKFQNNAVLRSLFKQKNELLFCDVVMRVCGKEVYAHSNVLAAASPYFQRFMKTTLPREFSQRTPQVIEIHIDGSEPNMFYDEAVSAVVDFIYTGVMAVRDDNVAQITEIAKIMQMDKVVKFCESYSMGTVQVGDLVFEDASTKHDKCVNTIPLFGVSAIGNKSKGKRVRSMAVQVMPTLLKRHDQSIPETKDIGTSTEKWPQSRLDTFVRVPKRRGRPPKPKPVALEPVDDPVELPQADVNRSENEIEEGDMEEITEMAEVEQSNDDVDTDSQRDTDEQIISLSEAQSSQNINVDTEQIEQEDNNVTNTPAQSSNSKASKQNKEKLVSTKASKDSADPVVEDVEFSVGRSARSGRIRKLPPKLRDTITADPIDNIVGSEIEFIIANERNIKKEPVNEDTIIELRPDIDDQNMKDEYQKENKRTRDSMDTEGGDDTVDELPPKRRKYTTHKTTHLGTEIVADIPPSTRRYSCDTCDFETKKVREMSNHRKLHKFEQNTCYYCDAKFKFRDELTEHIEKHKGPLPFFCPTCHIRFKSRTMMNLHLPKHSDEKPFICEICSAGFKWKHALKGHMITHSGKKEHLCDICGYATAHKSQLKAHKLIHTGNLFRCDYPGCDFQATKRQNLKYHTLTHTREKPHQCEVCGQAFSLVKNMRRHMLLHGQEKHFKCSDCEFASTRYDKLKEHRLKQHGFGTAPEKRVRTADLVHAGAILTPSASALKYEAEDTEEEEAEGAGEGEEDEEVVNAAVMLQALDSSEHAMMQEFERHVAAAAQSNVLFQMRGEQQQKGSGGTTVLHLTEGGTQKLVTIQPEQMLAALPGGLGEAGPGGQIVLQPVLSQAQLSLNDQINHLTNEEFLASGEYIVSGDGSVVSSGANHVQDVQGSTTTYMMTGTDAATATSTYITHHPDNAISSQATAYVTSDGTIVHLDPTSASALSQDDTTQHFPGAGEAEAGAGGELVTDGLTGEEVQYAEIMIQDGTGEYTETGQHIALG